MIPNPCLTCGRLTTDGTRCHKCYRDKRNAGYDSPAYRALGRPSGPCQLRRPGCTGRGWETWDHIVPLSKGGGNERSNVRPACEHCNKSRSNRG